MNEIDEFLFLHLVEAIELCQCKGKQHFLYVISAPSSACPLKSEDSVTKLHSRLALLGAEWGAESYSILSPTVMSK